MPRRPKELPLFTVKIGSREALEVLRLAAMQHGNNTDRDPSHDPMKCTACGALDRLEEEIEMGVLEATEERRR